MSVLSKSEAGYLNLLYAAVEQEAIGKKTIQALSAACKRSYATPLAMVSAFQKILPETILENQGQPTVPTQKKSHKLIVLAQYLAPSTGGEI